MRQRTAVERIAGIRRARIPTLEIHRAVMQMESTETTCLYCGWLNQIGGFSEVHAFVCRPVVVVVFRSSPHQFFE
jgi:hypothetical protein